MCIGRDFSLCHLQTSSEIHPVSYSMDTNEEDQNQDTDSLHTEDAGDTFLRDGGNHLQDQTASIQKTTVKFTAMRTSNLKTHFECSVILAVSKYAV
jgi:hypothetical protein